MNENIMNTEEEVTSECVYHPRLKPHNELVGVLGHDRVVGGSRSDNQRKGRRRGSDEQYQAAALGRNLIASLAGLTERGLTGDKPIALARLSPNVWSTAVKMASCLSLISLDLTLPK
jgi:hypothetical protein